jgi:hypothetical protein
MNNKLLIIVAISLCFFTKINAQQCGYEYHGAIILDIMDANRLEKVRGLKIHLQYENGNAIREYYTNTITKNLTKNCIDSFVFWENSIPYIEKQKDCVNSNFYRQYYPNASDNYICIVPTYSGKNDLSEFSHRRSNEDANTKKEELKNSPYFLQIKIVDIDGEKNGGYYETQILTIPAAAVTDICSDRLFDGDRIIFSRHELDPIRIELKANTKD